jgi:predicted P-loop ATPase
MLPPPVAGVPAGTLTVPPPVAGEASVLTMNRKMQFDATLEALVYVLAKQTQASIGFDEFRGRVMIAPASTEEWRPLSDTDMIQLRETLAREQRFAPIGKELMSDALQLVAARHRFDSAITWLNGLQWDGAPRIERFLTTYCGTADDEYTRAVGLYIWTGLAGRVLEPGCQLDMVVAFQSPQGKMKSTGFQAMVPADDCFTDGLSLHDDDDDFKRLIRGKLLIEVAEMAGLSKGDINVVKRAITRRQEEWIEKFQTQPTRFKRRCMLFASTNEEHFLPPDETGQRRWVPVEITQLDRIRIAADRDQLWAEGAARWRVSGVAWQAAESLAKGRHVKYEQTDVWESAIEGWLDKSPVPMPGTVPSPPPRARPLTLSDILTGAIGLNTAHQDAKAEKRAARVMRQLGFEVRTVRLDAISKPCRRWVPRE